jgi:hypothetical protein
MVHLERLHEVGRQAHHVGVALAEFQEGGTEAVAGGSGGGRGYILHVYHI